MARKSVDGVTWRVENANRKGRVSATRRFTVTAPSIHLQTPAAKAAARVSEGIRFSWFSDGVGRAILEISGDEHFSTRRIRITDGDGDGTVDMMRWSGLRRLARLAEKNGGRVWWRVTARPLGGGRPIHSETRELRLELNP
jgi:hypothetical protein